MSFDLSSAPESLLSIQNSCIRSKSWNADRHDSLCHRPCTTASSPRSPSALQLTMVLGTSECTTPLLRDRAFESRRHILAILLTSLSDLSQKASIGGTRCSLSKGNSQNSSDTVVGKETLTQCQTAQYGAGMLNEEVRNIKNTNPLELSPSDSPFATVERR